MTLDEASFHLEKGGAPGTGNAHSVRLSLPDSWRQRRPDAGGFGWYELDFEAPSRAHEAWALLLPSVNMNAEAFVNEARLGSGGRFDEPVAHNFNRPLFFAIPSPLLHPGRNAIRIRLWAYPHAQAGLGPILVGPESALRPLYHRRMLLQLGLAQLATAIAWLTALFILALWVGTRFDGVYGWFGMAILCWSVTSLNYWVRDIPLPHWTWERIVHPALECFAVALAIWAHRILDLRRPRTEKALLGFLVLALAASARVPNPFFYATVNPLHAASLAIGGYATVLVLTHLRRFSAWERGLYGFGGAIGLAFAARDLGVQLGWIPSGGVHLFPYLVPVILLGFGASLVARFVSSLEVAEVLNRQLEQRVRDKSRELEERHERVRRLEREQMIAAERERIMAEMHDGMGGHLVSALTLLESGGGSPAATADALRAALADMRVVIDSLDPALGDLPALLGALRARVDPLLERSGLQLQWRVADVPEHLRLGPERSLHVMRVLQEAIANAVRHAGASTLIVEARREDGRLTLEVRDDGRCFDAEAPRVGRGLANMRRRAEEIGARFEIGSDGGGSRVSLGLPDVEPDEDVGGPTRRGR